MLSGLSLVGDLIGLLVLLAALIVLYYKWAFKYWERRNIPSPTPSIPFGNLQRPTQKKDHIAFQLKEVYDEMKGSGAKHCGLYAFFNPNYIPLDLDLVKHILSKDFQNFTDRGFYYNEKVDPLSGHLFLLGGQKWKNLRAKLTPTFSSGKMKMMFQTLLDCEVSLRQKMEKESVKSGGIDIKEVLACFTTDVIGSCGFGLDLKSFQQDNSPFRVYGRKIFLADSKLQAIKVTFSIMFPKFANLLSMSMVPEDVSQFFTQVVKDAVEQRLQNDITRKDFLQLLIDMNKGVTDFQHDGKSLDTAEMAAQCFVFFLAGFETSSTTMTFTLYELAKNQELQDKVREEITKVLAKYEGEITYDAIKDLKYMDMVIDETLRKYPPATLITRQCVKDYQLPRDIIDEDITIEKGTQVIVPIYSIHHDPEYYPDPEKYDPERFSEANKRSRPQYAHIPFGEGPRLCIGMRFGLMQTKVGLTSLLRNYKFTVNKRMADPIKMNPKSIVLSALGDMWLDAKKI